MQEFLEGKLYIQIKPEDKDYVPLLQDALPYKWASGDDLDSDMTYSLIKENPIYIVLYDIGSIYYTHLCNTDYINIREFLNIGNDISEEFTELIM